MRCVEALLRWATTERSSLSRVLGGSGCCRIVVSSFRRSVFRLLLFLLLLFVYSALLVVFSRFIVSTMGVSPLFHLSFLLILSCDIRSPSFYRAPSSRGKMIVIGFQNFLLLLFLPAQFGTFVATEEGKNFWSLQTCEVNRGKRTKLVNPKTDEEKREKTEHCLHHTTPSNSVLTQ